VAGSGSIPIDPTIVSAPTITLRDASGAIIYQDLVRNPNFFMLGSDGSLVPGFPILSVGIRSGLIVDCSDDKSTVTVILAVLGPPRSLVQYTINWNTKELTGFEQTLLAYPSIRGMTQLPAPRDCEVVFAPLVDLEDTVVLNSASSDASPTFQTYNWCDTSHRRHDQEAETEEMNQEQQQEQPEDHQKQRRVLGTPTLDGPIAITLGTSLRQITSTSCTNQSVVYLICILYTTFYH
jgi:hypothetical protein